MGPPLFAHPLIRAILLAGLYLHIPFCEHKCIYCDFYSIESLDPIDSFVAALKLEIAMQSGRSADPFETIFFGGGTPSLLAPRTVGEILELLHATFTIDAGAEVTLEANPGTVDERKLAELRSVGINRVSFGVQSFHEDDLKFLTRIHSADQARDSVRAARRAGFDNLSLDLIFSLPGQTMERWDANLRSAIALEPEHISCYSLIVEKGTPLARMVESHQVSTLPVESDARLYEHTMDVLLSAGFEQYEISNFARPGLRSRHNSNYWNHTNYVGFGPSAHSYWNGRRWWNISNLRTYLEKIDSGELPVAGEESLTSQQLLDEEVMLGLRSGGIDLDGIERRYGVRLEDGSGEELLRLVADGMAVRDGSHFRLTCRGYLISDEVSGSLLSRVEMV